MRQLDRDVPAGAAVVVHDSGGGTFDASVVRRTATGFEVLALDGLNDLGGVDIDEAIVAYLRTQVGRPDLWRRLLAPEHPDHRRHWRAFREEVQRPDLREPGEEVPPGYPAKALNIRLSYTVADVRRRPRGHCPL